MGNSSFSEQETERSIVNKLSGRAVIYLVAIASMFVILFGIRASADILNPILLAAVITITVLPIPGRLKARGLPGWLALVLTILVVTLVLALVILVVFVSITELSTDIPTYFDSASQQTSAGTTSSEDGTGDTSAQSTSTSAQYGEFVQGIIRSVVGLLVQFGWALVIFFFMLSAAISIPAPSRLGMDPNTPSIGRFSRLTQDVRKYMSILTVVNLLVALGDTIFLLIMGVEYALLWGLLAWFMGYIPSIGFMIALIPPVLMAYAQFGVDTALIVLGGYILINGGVQNFIQPKIMGQGLRISPAVVFIGLFVWGYLLGGIGAILAVPLTMLVLIAMENFPGTRNLAILMRYTGEEKKEEREKAANSLKGTISRINIFTHSDKSAQDEGEPDEDKIDVGEEIDKQVNRGQVSGGDE